MKTFSVSEIQDLIAEHYGKNATYVKTLVGELDQNIYIRTKKDHEFILKIAHPDRSIDHLEMENQAMEFLVDKNTGLLLPKPVKSLSGELIVDISGQSMRLIKWLSGRLWKDINPITYRMLVDVGIKVARLHSGLIGYKHPELNRSFQWDPSKVSWVKEKVAEIFKKPEQRELIERSLNLIDRLSAPLLANLPQSVCYLDANDHNIIIGGKRKSPHVLGFIDFGDMIWTHRINELAITIAYTCMDFSDPLSAACKVIEGFTSIIPLDEKEIKALYGQILARWVISLSFSTLRESESGENPYLQVSAGGAWKMLEQWTKMHPHFIESCFREAAGFEPDCNNQDIINYLKENQSTFFPVLGREVNNDKLMVFDWSVGSAELGNFDQMQDVEYSTYSVFRKIVREGADFGVGRYDEPRPVYTTDAYAKEGNEGLEWRTIHIGIDLFCPAGAPLFAPIDGEVVICHNDEGDKEYGPLLVLKHQVTDKLSFFTLYGHNDPEVLNRYNVGDLVKSGERIALIGDFPENGNWVPHVHFQIISDLLGYADDFPGVVYPKQRNIWKSICPDPNLILGLSHPMLKYLGHEKSELLDLRKQYLGKNLSLSYHQPLYMQRGYMQYLYDENGQKFLDTVNNVPHVGHQHPRVVQAAQRQMAILNTNTRYLHEEILLYAEELLNTLPDHLEVVYFVNSGSEANELALRMIRTVTGKEGLLALDHGYHGNTNQLVDISAYKFNGPGGQGIGYDANLIHVPDLYRNPSLKDSGESTGIFKDLLRISLEELVSEGVLCAGLIHETILSCGGQLVMPPHFFKEIYEEAQEAGMLMIADEVQTGLGRVGTHWWSFELAGVAPDIVTMGKPIGNGFPLGAVATTRRIADEFANGMEYFNTFGGNPLSCAVGRSVLAVVQDEGLKENALTVGNFLKDQLKGIQNEFPMIGDVRGEGLFLGIELVTDPVKKTHATTQTGYLVNRMRDYGILTSSDGPFHNVMKIKPPICFSHKDAERFVDTFLKVMKEDFMQPG
jgi:4-aminobutyrate aminotransferase-like enzyme/Ser/Thr protein kinase RdoA (MazF antagonist)